MTALGDALAAAQSRAVAALGKQYVGGQMDGDTLRLALDSIGCTDPAAREILAANLTDDEYAYIVGKLGEGGMARLFGVTR